MPMLALAAACAPVKCLCQPSNPRGNSPVADASAANGFLEEAYSLDNWRTAEGLPHNTINAILQTRDGFLWLGTAAGLARFDGAFFTVPKEGAARELREAPVAALLEDRKGVLWVGTADRGLFGLGGATASKLTMSDGLANDAITSLAQDAAGDLWIGTQGGLNRLRHGHLEKFVSPAIREDDPIVALHAGKSGTLWITTRYGLYELKNGTVSPFVSDELPQSRNTEFVGAYEDRAGNLWAFGATFLLNLTQGQRLNAYFNSPELVSSRVWTICEQANGTFWIGTSGRGLFRFRGGRFEPVGIRLGLDQCELRALYADPTGGLWVGTAGRGLMRVRTRRFEVIGAEQGLESSRIAAITADGAGRLWIGTADMGLLSWDGRRVAAFNTGSSLDSLAQIQTLCMDGASNLWVGTLGAGLWQIAPAGQSRRYTTADGLSDDVILSVASIPERGEVWAGTRAGLIHRIIAGRLESHNLVEGFSGSPILCLFVANEGLLAGTESGGILRWEEDRFVKLATPPELAAKPVRCLFEDRSGRLWAGTIGNGAFCRTGTKWVRISIRNGLGSDSIAQIVQDDTGTYWFGAEEDLFKVRLVDVEEFLGGTRESLASIPASTDRGADMLRCAVGWPAIARGTNGVLWLATSSALLPMNPQSRGSAEPAPPVILEQVLVDGRPRPLGDGSPIRLGPGARSLDLEFTAISFTVPQKIRFRHKLENFDADWVQSGDSRRAHYGPLPAGEYRFHVIAANADGVWNERGASVSLVVIPPIWREGWFVALIVLATLALVYGAARYVALRRLRARLQAAEHRHAMERERARIAQDMHDEIGSKLTRISFLSEVARQAGEKMPDVAAPVESIATVSRDLLQSLDEIVWAVNPRNDNLEHMAGYLEQHAREYFQGTAVECNIQVPAHLPVAPLSAETRHNVFLAFEESLNNSLKHAQASKVDIVMSLAENDFEIRIRDNGAGFDPVAGAQSGRSGLCNMKTRLDAVGGSCQIVSQAGQGTSVTLRFPLPKS